MQTIDDDGDDDNNVVSPTIYEDRDESDEEEYGDAMETDEEDKIEAKTFSDFSDIEEMDWVIDGLLEPAFLDDQCKEHKCCSSNAIHLYYDGVVWKDTTVPSAGRHLLAMLKAKMRHHIYVLSEVIY